MKRELNFDNFFIYEGNKVAYLAAQKVVEFPGELFNPLYIYSGTGLGKTHLLWAIYHELKKKSTTLFFTAKDFEKYLEDKKVLETQAIVDDLHIIATKYHTALLGIIDSCLAGNKQICFSGIAAPRDLKNFDAKLLSRLEGGLVCDITSPKEMALIEMIKQKSGEAGILLPDEVSLELAQISTGSIRAIEGMINRLVAYSSLGNVTLDIDAVRMILKEFYPKGIYSPVTSLLEELKKNASEVLQGVSEKLDIRDEYKEKIYIWEMKGFDTSTLKTLIEGDVEILKEEYDKFIKKVERLIELQKEFGSLNVAAFPDDTMKIESMLFSPDHVDDIGELISKIKTAVQIEAAEKAFDNYIVGECNKNAFDIYKQQVLRGLGKNFNPFVIFGKTGTGKTRFLKEIFNDILAQNKSVKLSDCAHPEDIPDLGDIPKYDVLLFDNLEQAIISDELRKKVFDAIANAVKSGKAIICSLEQFPSGVPLLDEEKSIFEFGIETELGEPSPDVVTEYIKLKLKPEEADKIISEGLPQFTSFGGIDEFLESLKTRKPEEVVSLGLPGEEKAEAAKVPEREKAEVITLGLPGEESVQEEVVEEEKAEVVSLGFPGEAVAEEKAVPLVEEHETEEEKVAAKGEPFKELKEERFILEEVLGELIEDNY